MKGFYKNSKKYTNGKKYKKKGLGYPHKTMNNNKSMKIMSFNIAQSTVENLVAAFSIPLSL
jgi:hypothetical protein